MKTDGLNVFTTAGILYFEEKIRPKEISPGGKIKSRDNKVREQNADFVCNTLAMPDWDCVFHEVFCFQTILILAGKSVL